MKYPYKFIIVLLCAVKFLSSCSTIEKASVHGLTSGYYILKNENKKERQVYLNVTNDRIEVYREIKKQPDKNEILTIPLIASDIPSTEQMVFMKQSLDIDITSILLKYRPSVHSLPAQLTTDLNIALYAGWRHDNFKVNSKKDPFGKINQQVGKLGYDIGFFAGPGTTLIGPFTTLNNRNNEYSGMIIQTGIAGFLESNIASFGLSIGYDHLLNPDRKIWIYRNKPWVGFIVGIALN